MTFAARSADQVADAELITAARGGDRAAYAVLYERHRAAAYQLARQLVRNTSEADDIVSETFAKIFTTLINGQGPDAAFRSYLLTSVRNTFYDMVRRGKKLTYTDDLERHDEGVPFEDPAVQTLDSQFAARAFSRLPERWQIVLWHTEIEGESPAEVAPILGMTANGVAALAYRAREGLRQAFLQEHIADVASDACRLTNERLGGYVRGGLSKRETAQVERHLEECDRCAAVAAEIADLNAGLRGVVAPLAIGGAALTSAYLAGGSTAKLAAFAWGGSVGFGHVDALINVGSALAGGVGAGATGAAGAAGVGAAGAGAAAGAAGSSSAGGAGSEAANASGRIAILSGVTVVVGAVIAAATMLNSSETSTQSEAPAPAPPPATAPAPPTAAPPPAPTANPEPESANPPGGQPVPEPAPPSGTNAVPPPIPPLSPTTTTIPPIPPVEPTTPPPAPSTAPPPAPEPTQPPPTTQPSPTQPPPTTTTPAPTTPAPSTPPPTTTPAPAPAPEIELVTSDSSAGSYTFKVADSDVDRTGIRLIIPAFLGPTDVPIGPPTSTEFGCTVTVDGAPTQSKTCGYVEASFDLAGTLPAGEDLVFTVTLPTYLTEEQEEMFLEVTDPTSSTPLPTN
ncbi:sigma-70 family RNA polymerase sigma factor [Epidermidibacterium keratini]|uniref:Sigma-70 family RNA polymerase sigma factor n=1 Tax=Epidermidibacterium keratini TaxID=1891644 RepID=A0A7L4YQJ8_9ACTN|nr:sigma-70 family RNA polymerase sigma factor [Epidermidibacterium keratini]QHC01525.1 sigma-70 family RNA polymerase sigma factor [Epidermidibacterium keratini]